MDAEKLAIRRLGQNIAKRRDALGLRQQDLAEKINADPSTVSKFERGKQAPSIGWLLRLAAALETTISELVAGIERQA